MTQTKRLGIKLWPRQLAKAHLDLISILTDKKRTSISSIFSRKHKSLNDLYDVVEYISTLYYKEINKLKKQICKLEWKI